MGTKKHYPQGAYKIGNRTDIGYRYGWPSGQLTKSMVNAIYQETNETTHYGDQTNHFGNPGIDVEDGIIVTKQCLPTHSPIAMQMSRQQPKPSSLRNFATDTPFHRIYNKALQYIKKRIDKFFIIVMTPPHMQFLQMAKLPGLSISGWYVIG